MNQERKKRFCLLPSLIQPSAFILHPYYANSDKWCDDDVFIWCRTGNFKRNTEQNGQCWRSGCGDDYGQCADGQHRAVWHVYDTE